MVEVESLRSHWDGIYSKSATEELGWYEELSEPSIRLISEAGISIDDNVFIAGAGSSKLVSWFQQNDFQNVYVNDVSRVALDKLSTLLDSQKPTPYWVVGDLLENITLNSVPKVKLWHDRAVLHFFLSNEDQNNYFAGIRNKVLRGGYVVIAGFSTDGARFCSGLPVNNLSTEMITGKLGSGFRLLNSFDFIDHTPSGEERPYIYTLFIRM